MHLDSYLDRVRDQLRAAAALGDTRTQEVADALGAAATSAMRLALVAAVSDAAGEITAGLLDQPGSPTVRAHLDGDDLAFDIAATELPEPAATAPAADEGDASARISLRLSESLKSAVDAAAARDGVSVNTWLVRAATAATRQGGSQGGSPGGGHDGTWRGRSDQRLTGWVNG